MWSESHIHLLPMLVCLTQGSIHTFLINSVRNIYSTSLSTHLLTVVYLKKRAPLFAMESCCKEVDFFARVMINHTLLYYLSFTGTSPLPVFSDL